MKRTSRLFFRSFWVSLVVLCCLIGGIYGTAKAYENTRRIGFGEYRKAFAAENGALRVLDFVWQIVPETTPQNEADPPTD